MILICQLFYQNDHLIILLFYFDSLFHHHLHFYFHHLYLMTLTFRNFHLHSHFQLHSHVHFHLHSHLHSLFDSSVLSVKIVSNRLLIKFYNSFCLGVRFFVLLFLCFSVTLMYLNPF